MREAKISDRIMKALDLAITAQVGVTLDYHQTIHLWRWIELTGKDLDERDALRAENERLRGLLRDSLYVCIAYARDNPVHTIKGVSHDPSGVHRLMDLIKEAIDD